MTEQYACRCVPIDTFRSTLYLLHTHTHSATKNMHAQLDLEANGGAWLPVAWPLVCVSPLRTAALASLAASPTARGGSRSARVGTAPQWPAATLSPKWRQQT